MTHPLNCVLDPVLAVVFPTACPACAAALDHPSRGPLCTSCWQALPRHQVPPCRCGLPLPPGLDACGRCRRGLNPLPLGASLGRYEGALRVLIHELKYRGRRRVAHRLAEELLDQTPVRRVLAPPALLVPVPLHPQRLRERGYNQAEELARAVGRGSGLPVVLALTRRRDTASQTGLTAAARRRNVAGAFAVVRRERVAGHAVVLVDDVLTTGATVRACAGVLAAAGVSELRLLTAARVT